MASTDDADVGGDDHRDGVGGFLRGLFLPHSHDAAESIDDAMQASSLGVRAVKVSLAGLGVTAVLQLVVVIFSGSVALLADTIHNFSDALTAVPLWIAFVLGRRAATRSYTYGYGRAEDLAGLFIVAMIALSAILAGYESVRRLIEPQSPQNLGWVLAAGLIGFVGNEGVAVYRVRAGRRIGSAALVADGVHARTDGFTSLAVVVGILGVWAGFPLADPIVGLFITVAIAVLLWGTARDIGRRLLDGVDPALVDQTTSALVSVAGGDCVGDVRLRWTGHRLHVTASIRCPPATSVEEFEQVARAAETAVRATLPAVGAVVVRPVSRDQTDHPSPRP
ncbi:MAG: cation diffusion facilitator family transporter [Nocardioidaceae bacterium]